MVVWSLFDTTLIYLSSTLSLSLKHYYPLSTISASLPPRRPSFSRLLSASLFPLSCRPIAHHKPGHDCMVLDMTIPTGPVPLSCLPSSLLDTFLTDLIPRPDPGPRYPRVETAEEPHASFRLWNHSIKALSLGLGLGRGRGRVMGGISLSPMAP